MKVLVALDSIGEILSVSPKEKQDVENFLETSLAYQELSERISDEDYIEIAGADEEESIRELEIPDDIVASCDADRIFEEVKKKI